MYSVQKRLAFCFTVLSVYWLCRNAFSKQWPSLPKNVKPSVSASLSTEAISLKEPINDVYFLKVPKCGSSSIQNILLRYGKAHNLSILLPRRAPLHSLGMFKPFIYDKRRILHNPKKYFNIFSHHSRFNLKVIKELMPKAKMVAIIRHPATMLESYYSYNGWSERFGVNFSSFIQHPDMYNKRIRNGILKMNNVMLYIFGLKEGDMRNSEAINSVIKMIEKEFDLIMILERFEESLVLLRQLLGWQWSDVTLVMPRNVRKSVHRTNISSSEMKLVTDWCWGDFRLYKHFSAAFDEKVKKYGTERMKRDLQKLRLETDRRRYLCLQNQTAENKLPFERPGAKQVHKLGIVQHRTLKAEAPKFCADYIKGSKEFTLELQERQRQLFPDTERWFIR